MSHVHHINIIVAPGQTEAAVHFYVDVLEMCRVPKDPAAGSPSGAWLDIGDGVQLHLSERKEGGHPDAHFAVTVDDFDATLQRIASAGHVWTPQSTVAGCRRGFTRDPAGNRVKIIEHPL